MLREITLIIFALAIVISSAFYLGSKLGYLQGEKLTCNVMRIDPDSKKCEDFLKEYTEAIYGK